MSTELQMYELADKFVTQTKRNIFLTGKAGTGKTTFLQQIREKTGKQMAVIAPTGVAAINAGGTTIHSFFQLPFTPFIPTVEGKKELVSKLKMQRHQRKVIRELELLVIDEVSMVRADIMDAIDTILRHLRYKNNEPFGGVQMIFIGDMYQLSPVAKDDEWRILSAYYDGIYFFHSKVIAEENLMHIEFEKIFRQSDMNFISLLNKIRNNKLDNEAYEILRQCYRPGFTAPQNDTYITLTTHNYKADHINQEELKKIKSRSKIFKAEIKGDFPEKSFPVDSELELKIGAKVMFLKNDTENPRRFYNGKIGKIVEFKEDTIVVECPGDDTIEVTQMDWHNIRYKTNEETQQIDEDILGVFKQFPLRLAWAITIHKSQGLTFDKAIIDAGDAFAAGQVYVALSRCRSLEGVVLTSPIHPFSVQNDDKIVAFSEKKNSINELSAQFEKSQLDFFSQILLDIFNFNPLVSAARTVLKTVQENDVLLNNDTVKFVQNVIKQAAYIQEIGTNFQQQLSKICVQLPVNTDYLQQRLQAAETFFSDKLSVLSETLKQSPAATDNKQIAKIYDDDLNEVFTFTEQKKHLIIGIKDHFSIQQYYTVKSRFVLPPWNVTSNSRKSKKEFLNSSHPALMNQLFSLRNDISDEFNLPIYIVAGTNTIREMADYLPLNKKELLLIDGFGDAKYEKFGEIFLDCIRDYCRENHLKSNMHNLPVKAKRERKEKQPKGASAKMTLDMFLQGNDIQTIARERNLTEGTIAGHLVRYIQDGTLDVKQFVTDERLNMIKEIVKNTEKSEEGVYFHLKNDFSEIEIKLGLAYLRR